MRKCGVNKARRKKEKQKKKEPILFNPYQTRRKYGFQTFPRLIGQR